MSARRASPNAIVASSPNGAGSNPRRHPPRTGMGRRCANGQSPLSPPRFLPGVLQPMADTQFDVLTIGNAIVDVIAPIDPGFLEREGLNEGIMHLVDAERSAYLYDRMPAEKRMISGGSSANTAAGVANFGGRAAFVAKVA